MVFVGLFAGIRISTGVCYGTWSCSTAICALISVAIIAAVHIVALAFAWKYAFSDIQTRLFAKNSSIQESSSNQDVSRFAVQNQDIPNFAVPYVPNFPAIPDIETRSLAKNSNIQDAARFAAENQDIPNLAIAFVANIPAENLEIPEVVDLEIPDMADFGIPDMADLASNEEFENFWEKISNRRSEKRRSEKRRSDKRRSEKRPSR